jgi:hypothetical protein
VRNWTSPAATAGSDKGGTVMTSTLESTPIAGPVPRENTVLADLVEAIETYPQTYLTIEIFEVNPEGPGTGVNAGEDVTFKVRVHNSGPLDVVDLTLLIESEDGATGVKYHDGNAFNPSMNSSPIGLVPGHMHDGEWVGTPEDHYHFEAGGVSHGKVDLVRVSVDAWNTNMDHPCKAHSDPVPSVGDTFAKSVLKA